LGSQELKSKVFKVKNMATRTEMQVPFPELVGKLQSLP